MPDEFSQPDAEEGQPEPSQARKKARTGSKGDRKAQAARYHQRNRSKRNAYMARYMAARRANARPLTSGEDGTPC